jgi:hypothetical protein
VGIRDPGSGIRDPGSENRDPRSGIRDPGSEIRDPRFGIRDPGSEIRDPKSGIRDPGTGIRDPAFKIWVPDPVPGIKKGDIFLRIAAVHGPNICLLQLGVPHRDSLEAKKKLSEEGQLNH